MYEKVFGGDDAGGRRVAMTAGLASGMKMCRKKGPLRMKYEEKKSCTRRGPIALSKKRN